MDHIATKANRYVPRRGPTEENLGDVTQIEIFRDNVLLIRDLEEMVTPGGIHKPDQAMAPKHTGVIVALGDEASALELCIGDRVMFGKYQGIDLIIEGRQHVLLMESNIIARIHGEIRTDDID